MSLLRAPLNAVLRLVEKPMLARVQDPAVVARRFERTARLFFHAPRGSRIVPHAVAGIPGLSVAAPGVAPDTPGLLYFHGGCYLFGSPRTHAAMLAALSARCGRPAQLPRYRLAPAHPFPAALDDALAVYTALGAQARGIVLGGDSAGGGLALALLAEILARGLPRPRGLFAFSPLTDMTFSGASIAANAARDPLLPTGRVHDIAAFYLQGQDPADPRASPLFASHAGAPPVWLAVADTEILRDDTLRMRDKLKGEGVDATLHRQPDLPHVWPIFHNILPEARDTLDALAGWIRALAPPSGES